jgi:hypothetical protein
VLKEYIMTTCITSRVELAVRIFSFSDHHLTVDFSSWSFKIQCKLDLFLNLME